MRKHIRVVLSISLVLTFFISNCFSVFSEREKMNYHESLNEYEFIMEMQRHSEDQLMKSGLTADETKQLLEFNYKDALYERAKLPEDALSALGYTEHQISLLKKFEKHPENDIDFVATAATLSESFSRNDGSLTFRTMTFSWVWSNMPLITLNDYVGVIWQGIDSSGLTVDTTSGDRSSSINYYDMDSGNLAQTVNNSTINYNAIKNYLVFNFPMTKYYNGLTLWAKSGSLTITISSEFNVHYAKIQGTYGHKILACNVTIDVSGGSWGISFTPTTKMNNYSIAIKAYILYFVYL